MDVARFYSCKPNTNVSVLAFTKASEKHFASIERETNMPLTANAALSKDKSTGKGVTLQHRHFAFIAATLKASKRAPDAMDEYLLGWGDIVKTFASECQATNPNFDWNRFMRACDADI